MRNNLNWEWDVEHPLEIGLKRNGVTLGMKNWFKWTEFGYNGVRVVVAVDVGGYELNHHFKNSENGQK